MAYSSPQEEEEYEDSKVLVEKMKEKKTQEESKTGMAEDCDQKSDETDKRTL